jgi:hypothetical protein
MRFSLNVGSNSGRGPLLLTGGLHFIILAIAGPTPPKSGLGHFWPCPW